jgi:hypothetical protein
MYKVKDVILSHLDDLKTGLLNGRLFDNRKQFIINLVRHYTFDDDGKSVRRKSLELENNVKSVSDLEDLILKIDNVTEIDFRTMRMYFWNHPELKEGETLIFNVRSDEHMNFNDIYSEIRLGEVAYTTYGVSIVPNMKPLFGKLKAK